MRRFFTLAPLALLTTACAARGYTPSTALERAGESPPTRVVAAPAESDAIAAWQLPAESPWARYEKLTLLTWLGDRESSLELPDVADLDSVRRAQNAAAHLAQSGMPPGTLWIVDLRGAASVAFGAALSRALPGRVAPVLTFNNWPAEEEAIPAEETLAALVGMRPALPSPAEANATPVFLLDAWRLAFRDEDVDDQITDNRYYLLGADLPDAATLRAHGIERIVYLVEDRDTVSTEEDDLHDVASDWQEGGIPVSIVDLAWLEGLGEPIDWRTNLGYYAVPIGPRFTFFSTPSFFMRAHGGFGGARAAPPGAYSSGGSGHAFATPHVGGGGGRTFASPHVGGFSG